MYHADPCPVPSLSSGIARMLVERSPRHAWAAHLRLNTMQEPETVTPAMEEGTLLHALILGTAQEIVEVDADDWRGKAAQAERAEARGRGAIAVLGWRMAELERCASAFREQLADHECAGALTAGQPEATLVWRDGVDWCRARADWLPDDPRAPLYDLKTTAGSADPDTWERALRDKYAFQAAWYLRGARALGLRPAGMVFLVVETAAPHGLCAFQPDPSLMAMADERVSEALAVWRACLAANHWPGYPRRVCHVQAPPWMLAKHEERQARAPGDNRYDWPNLYTNPPTEHAR